MEEKKQKKQRKKTNVYECNTPQEIVSKLLIHCSHVKYHPYIHIKYHLTYILIIVIVDTTHEASFKCALECALTDDMNNMTEHTLNRSTGSLNKNNQANSS